MADAKKRFFSYHKRPDGIIYHEDGSKFCSSAQLINGEVMPGCMHLSAVWYLSPGLHDTHTHIHDVDEVVGFIGTDPEDTESLSGTLRFFVDGEWVETDRSCFIYLPAGVPHCPYEIVSLERPIIHLSALPGTSYTRTDV